MLYKYSESVSIHGEKHEAFRNLAFKRAIRTSSPCPQHEQPVLVRALAMITAAKEEVRWRNITGDRVCMRRRSGWTAGINSRKSSRRLFLTNTVKLRTHLTSVRLEQNLNNWAFRRRLNYWKPFLFSDCENSCECPLNRNNNWGSRRKCWCWSCRAGTQGTKVNMADGKKLLPWSSGV